ncbi:MAG: ABC transporter substrate-binding protein [Rhodospirillales bacterium]
MRNLTAGIVALVAMLAFSPAPAMASPDEAKAKLENLATEALGHLSNKDKTREEQVALFRELMVKTFDLDLIAQFAVGRYWRRAEDAEKKEYLSLFRDYMVATYSVRLNEYNGESLKLVGARGTDQEGDVLVDTLITRDVDNLELPVAWRMRRTGDKGYLVTDILVDNVSLAVAQRSEFVSVIRGSGGTLSGLNEKLKARMAENPS